MKVLNYLKSISSTCGGELWKIVKRNPLAWVVFGLLLLSDWKIAILSWIIPVIVLTCLEIRKEKRREDWEIILTPTVNFIIFSIILTSFVIKCFEKLKSISLIFVGSLLLLLISCTLRSVRLPKDGRFEIKYGGGKTETLDVYYLHYNPEYKSILIYKTEEDSRPNRIIYNVEEIKVLDK